MDGRGGVGVGKNLVSSLVVSFHRPYGPWKEKVVALLLLALSVLLTGCSYFVDRDQPVVAHETLLRWEAGHTVGQTFVARHGGLSGVEIYIKPGSGGHTLVLHLRESPLHQVDLRTAHIALPPGSPEGFYRFSFPPIQNSHTRYYYFFLEQIGTDPIIIPIADLTTYADGTMYYDHKPEAVQAAFRLVYDMLYIALDLLLMTFWWIVWCGIVIIILFLCGYMIVRRWSNERGLDFTSTLIISAASALGLWMGILVWMDVVGVRLNKTNVRLIVAAGILIGLIFWIRDHHLWRRRTYWLGEDPWATLAVWVAVLAALALRLFVGRGMVMLPGSDTYHHALIVKLFEDQGGIPNSYEPYAPLLSFSYHFGFHSIVALFRWMFELDLLSATKVTALVLNGAIAATAGFTSERLTRSRWAGVITAILIGLIMVSPFVLLRWGRFTQTTGMFFLPLGILVAFTRKERINGVWPALVIISMVFSHIRVTFFWLILMALMFFGRFLTDGWLEIKRWLQVGVVSLALALPWLFRLIWVHWDPYDLRITYPILEGVNDLRRLEESVLFFPTNRPLVVVMIGLIVATLRIKHAIEVRMLVGWTLLLVGGMIIFSGIRLSLWDVPTTTLSLSIPLAIMGGVGGHAIEQVLRGRARSVGQAVLATALGLGALVGIWNLPKLIYTGIFYLRPGDLSIMRWIQENTPENALFMVNAIEFDWSPGWMVGIDSGYWIPLLTYRSTVLPPMLYPIEWASPVVSQNLKILGEFLKNGKDKRKIVCENFRDLEITHIFWIDINSQFDCECLTVLYNQDRAVILKINK